MTAGGAENELAFLNDDKDEENLLSVASNVLGRSSTNEGYKILFRRTRLLKKAMNQHDILE